MRNIILALIMALMGIVAPMKAIATVSNGNNQVIYNGDGVTSIFSFTYNVYNSASENDLLVSELNTATGAVTNLTLNTDYTVALTHATPSPGSITLTAGALAVGTNLSILRQLPLTQLVTESDNSATPAAVRNNVYDRNIMISQQLTQSLTRALLQNVFTLTSTTLPAPLAGYALGWDPTGTFLTNILFGGSGSTIPVPIPNTYLSTLTTANLVNGSSLFGTANLTSLGIGSSNVGSKLDVQGTMRIFNGNVGIGSVTPIQLLDVQGTVRASFFQGYQPYIKVSEVEVSGTSGGTSVSDSAWHTRVLNTIDADTQGISSLASNQITLPAGTYLIRATSPFEAGGAQIRVENITGTAVLLTGPFAGAITGQKIVCSVVGKFTINVSSAIAIQYQSGNAQVTTGLGSAGSFGSEIYTVAEFTKIN